MLHIIYVLFQLIEIYLSVKKSVSLFFIERTQKKEIGGKRI